MASPGAKFYNCYLLYYNWAPFSHRKFSNEYVQNQYNFKLKLHMNGQKPTQYVQFYSLRAMLFCHNFVPFSRGKNFHGHVL